MVQKLWLAVRLVHSGGLGNQVDLVGLYKKPPTRLLHDDNIRFVSMEVGVDMPVHTCPWDSGWDLRHEANGVRREGN